MTKRALSLLFMLAAVAVFVAVPATALGQSAGDEQYVDPFAEDQGGQTGDDGQSDDGSQAPATPTPEEQPVTPAPAAPAQSASDPAEGTLPRTGAPVSGMLLVGAVLTAGGFALRRAWPLPE